MGRAPVSSEDCPRGYAGVGGWDAWVRGTGVGWRPGRRSVDAAARVRQALTRPRVTREARSSAKQRETRTGLAPRGLDAGNVETSADRGAGIVPAIPGERVSPGGERAMRERADAGPAQVEHVHAHGPRDGEREHERHG